jgi:TM2 domain-containing membrane protein YozV
MDRATAHRLMLYDAQKRAVLWAYVLLAIGGLLGAHRFYLRRWGTGLLMLAITLVSLPMALLAFGWAGLFVTILWVLLDALRLPGMVQRTNARLAESLA